jgi:hypothetical protein
MWTNGAGKTKITLSMEGAGIYSAAVASGMPGSSGPVGAACAHHAVLHGVVVLASAHYAHSGVFLTLCQVAISYQYQVAGSAG